MLLADQPAFGFVKVEHCRRVAVDAHLVLDRAADNAIAFADAAVRVGQELRHEEQRDALDACWRAFDSRQHQVNDVVGEIVLAGRDEDLLAGDGVGAVRRRDRTGLDEAEISAAMGLGQAHRARPLARGHLRQIAGLEVFAAMDRQGRDGAVGEAGIHPEGDVGGIGVFAEQDRQERRKSLAPIGGIAGKADPSALDQRLISLLEALGGGDAAIVMSLAAVDVANAVERLHDLLDEFRPFAQDRLDNIDRCVGKAGRVRVPRVVEHIAQQKNRVVHRRLVSRHRHPQHEKRRPAHRGRLGRASAVIRFTYELSCRRLQGES